MLEEHCFVFVITFFTCRDATLWSGFLQKIRGWKSANSQPYRNIVLLHEDTRLLGRSKPYLCRLKDKIKPYNILRAAWLIFFFFFAWTPYNLDRVSLKKMIWKWTIFQDIYLLSSSQSHPSFVFWVCKKE